MLITISNPCFFHFQVYYCWLWGYEVNFEEFWFCDQGQHRQPHANGWGRHFQRRKVNLDYNLDTCPVHLPGQIIFCLGQNQICPIQNKFVKDKIFFVQDKNFVHGLKIIFAFGKLVSCHGQNFCLGQKIFCPGQNYFVLYKFDFVPDRWKGH